MNRNLATVALIAPLVALPTAAWGEIANPSFENGWGGWTDIDPNGDATAISGHFNTGAHSAKITRETGRFEQTVPVQPDSDYILRAMVSGPGQVGVALGDTVLGDTVLTEDSPGDGDAWMPLEVAFSSGSATSVVIFGAHNGGEGRFDDFVLEAVGGPALTAPAQAAAADPVVYATLAGACAGMSQLRVVSAQDDGTNDGHTPDLTIDASFLPDSRWSSELPGKELLLDMGEEQTLKELGIAWYRGDERRSTFEVAVSVDGRTFTPIIDRRQSSGTIATIERIDFDDTLARYIRITGFGNDSNDWNSIVEVQAYGCGSGEIASQGDGTDVDQEVRVGLYGLATNRPPSENFDLTRWKITLPVDRDGDGRADEIGESDLSTGWFDDTMFYTDPATGGMVFRVVSGDATTPGSRYARVELREMLRAGNTSIPTRGTDGDPSANNWVFSAAPDDIQAAAGGVDGTLIATLTVNRVTRTGDGSQIGRVIIGQIHARDGEPIRLYYRKLPTNTLGSVYYIHELEGRPDIYVPLIGDRGDRIDNPEDGIALDEVFSYEIAVTGEDVDGTTHPMLHVRIIRDDGTVIEAPPLDMIDSNYAHADEFMYFKAGAYSQNNTSIWPDRDFDQVTFFALEARH